MIEGRVTSDRQARPDVALAAARGDTLTFEVTLGTGFDGYLTLPSSIIARIDHRTIGTRQVTLADGSRVLLETHVGTAIWHGKKKAVLILAADGGPLLGMGMLAGNHVAMHVVDDGQVIITEPD